MALKLNGDEILNLFVDDSPMETVILNGVTIARKPVITAQPAGGRISDVESITLSVSADGFGSTLSYQWYTSDDLAISGATSSNYLFSSTEMGIHGFYCRVTGFGGYTQSDIVNVTVEADLTRHVLSVGYKKEEQLGITLAETCGFLGETGDFQPRLTHTGGVCFGLCSVLLFGGEEQSGEPYNAVFYVTSLNLGVVTINVEGFGDLVGNLELIEEEGSEPYSGCSWDNTTSESFYNFLLSRVNQDINVTIKYEST